MFAAFDQFPSPKGAAVHILHSSQALFERFGGGLLYVIGGGSLPPYQFEDGIEIVRFTDEVPNLLQRAELFSRRLAATVAMHADTLEVVHVRDPWSAIAALHDPNRCYRVLYEANALPSIELPAAYPAMLPSTIAKVRELEQFCLQHADRVVTVSGVLQAKLLSLGVDGERLAVVPNGADVVAPEQRPARPDGAPSRYVVYVGALQTWQGVDQLLRAFARLADLDDLGLVICSATRRKRARPFLRFARRLGVDGRVDWRFGLRHNEIAAWLAHAELSVAPLADCPRNVEQGCCPLKVLESMAAGTPVVASDLPAVRELVVDGEHGRLVRPDRPAELARATRVMLEYPERSRAMGDAAREHVASTLTWDHNRQRLDAVYDDLRVPAR
ncbi:MAG: glycosyltransferase family 4 protein [Actinobacteria bacterium]|nr:glycosyltransferase family 4 protein [Actinomycetota bacterium]